MLDVFVLRLLQIIQYCASSYTCSGQILYSKALEARRTKMVFEFVVGKVVLVHPIFTVKGNKLIFKELGGSFSGRFGEYKF